MLDSLIMGVLSLDLVRQCPQCVSLLSRTALWLISPSRDQIVFSLRSDWSREGLRRVFTACVIRVLRSMLSGRVALLLSAHQAWNDHPKPITVDSVPTHGTQLEPQNLDWVSSLTPTSRASRFCQF
ncbi:hypothetical protein BDW68DRAFT_161506 [Aspergillus falconensis]